MSVADRSADWLTQALRDLEQAEQSMQAGLHAWAWGHILTRLWTALPEQDWQPELPVDLEDRLRLLDGFYIPTRYPDSDPEGTPGGHFGRLQSEPAILHAGVVSSWVRAALAQRR